MCQHRFQASATAAVLGQPTQVKPVTVHLAQQHRRWPPAWPRRKAIAKKPPPNGCAPKFRTGPPERVGQRNRNFLSLIEVDDHFVPLRIEVFVSITVGESYPVPDARGERTPVAPSCHPYRDRLRRHESSMLASHAQVEGRRVDRSHWQHSTPAPVHSQRQSRMSISPLRTVVAAEANPSSGRLPELPFRLTARPNPGPGARLPMPVEILSSAGD